MHAYVYIYIYIYTIYGITHQMMVYIIYIYAYDSKPIFYDTTYAILDVYNYVHIDAHHMLCILYTHTCYHTKIQHN